MDNRVLFFKGRNYMNIFSRTLAVFFTSFLLSNIASADLQFGIAAGFSSSEKLENSDISAILLGNRINVAEDFSQDNTDSAFRLFSSYNLNEWLDIELSYTDYGDNSFAGKINKSPTSNTTGGFDAIEATEELTGFALSLSPKKQYPSGIVVNAKLGALMWNLNGDGRKYGETNFISTGLDTYTESLKIDDDGVDFILGVGISYSNFSITYERVSVNSSETDILMLSFKY